MRPPRRLRLPALLLACAACAASAACSTADAAADHDRPGRTPEARGHGRNYVAPPKLETRRTTEKVPAAQDDESAVRAAIQHYLDGHATGDPAHFRAVFHPDSRLFWIRDGALTTRTAEEFIAGARGRPAPDEADRRRRIAAVHVTGDAAVARVELDYPASFITDYFTLLKVDGTWRIMNKIFHVRPKEGSG